MLLLLDTASLYFRAFYGVPDSMTAPDGTPVNAVRGLLDYIARLVDDRRPPIWWRRWTTRGGPTGGWRRCRRTSRTGSAPSGEEEVPDTLTPQVPIICDVLDALGIARVGAADYEADDVIGTLATEASRRGRDRHGRPRSVPAGRRQRAGPHRLRRQGRRQPRDHRRGRGRSALRHPGPGIRGVRHPARRPVGRASWRAGRRRQDRRGVDHHVRDGCRGRRGGARFRRRVPQGRPGEGARGAGLSQPRRRCGAGRVRRAARRRTTTGCPRSPATRRALDALARPWGLGSSVTRVLTALRSGQRRVGDHAAAKRGDAAARGRARPASRPARQPRSGRAGRSAA